MVLSLQRQVEGHLAPEALFRFDIAVTEALVNLVLHAHTPQKDAPIDITLAITGGTVVVGLFDPPGAAPFDLRAHARALAEVDSLAENGRGLGLILECADAVDYGVIVGRHRLCLTFKGRE